jgi:hypothetical protein
MPTYLRGDPLRDAGRLYSWTPIALLGVAEPVVEQRTVSGWERTGHTRVPAIASVG